MDGDDSWALGHERWVAELLGRTMKRIPACTVSYCPAPTDPDWHKCWICGALATEHHHVKARGMGGSKSRKKDPKNIVALCHSHHEMVTTGGWGCTINHVPGRGLVFWAWDLHGKTQAERVLEAVSSAAVGAYQPTVEPTGPTAAPPPVSEREEVMPDARRQENIDQRVVEGAEAGRGASRAESAAAERTGEGGRPASAPRHQGLSAAAPSALAIPGTMTETSLTLPQDLSYEDWSEGIKGLSKFGHHFQFFLGDAIIFGEDRFGEEAWQALDSLGLQPESIGNIVRVCRAIPPPSRHAGLTYSHHVVGYMLDDEERDTWFAAAEAGGWSIQEFRSRVHGKSARAKRYSLDELRAFLMQRYESAPDTPIGEISDFLDALEEQGE